MDNCVQDEALITIEALRLHSPSIQRRLGSRTNVSLAPKILKERLLETQKAQIEDKILQKDMPM